MAWNPGSVKPTVEAVYLRRSGSIARYSYWNGTWWSVAKNSIEGALLNRHVKSIIQDIEWCVP